MFRGRYQGLKFTIVGAHDTLFKFLRQHAYESNVTRKLKLLYLTLKGNAMMKARSFRAADVESGALHQARRMASQQRTL